MTSRASGLCSTLGIRHPIIQSERGDPRYFPMPAGESAGLIADTPSAADVVREIIREADDVVRGFTPFAH
jgi:hypothetical protein